MKPQIITDIKNRFNINIAEKSPTFITGVLARG